MRKKHIKLKTMLFYDLKTALVISSMAILLVTQFPLIFRTTVAGSYVLPYTDEWVIASTTILIFFLIFGVTANSITIAAIHSSPRLKWVNNEYHSEHSKYDGQEYKQD